MIRVEKITRRLAERDDYAQEKRSEELEDYPDLERRCQGRASLFAHANLSAGRKNTYIMASLVRP